MPRLLYILCIASSVMLIASAQNKSMRAPVNAVKPVLQKPAASSPALLSFYQRYISAIDGERTCPMHPACSQYAKLCFQKHSAFRAYILTCERILRCGKDLYLYQENIRGGYYYWIDFPPEPTHE